MKIKICGVTRPADAEIAERRGAAYVGTILVPGSPRLITLEGARSISKAISIPLVVVTSSESPEEAAGMADEAGARVIQIHSEWSTADLRALRAMGEWDLWQVVRVRSGDDIVRGAERAGEVVDLVLLDGWHPSGLGGTGTTFPWETLTGVRERLGPGLSIGIAGGLTPANVAEAVAELAPDLVDVSSGVEGGPGIKDARLIREFVENATMAQASRAGPSDGGQ